MRSEQREVPRHVARIAAGAALLVAITSAISSIAGALWSLPLWTSAAPYEAAVWSAVALCWVPIFTRRTRAVVPIAIAITLWAVGDVVWDTAELMGRDPGTGLADIAYLAGYPLLAFGIWRLVRQVSDRDDRRAAALDGVLVAAAAGMLLWKFFGAPTYADGDASFGGVVGAAYPMLDVVLVASCVWLAFTPARSRQVGLLVSMVGLTLVGDVAYAAGQVHANELLTAVADALYPLAYLLAAAACWSAVPTEGQPAGRTLQRGRVVLLGAAFTVFPVSFAVSSRASATDVIVAGAVVTLAFTRLAWAAVDADRRHGDLDRAMRALDATRAALTREATRDALTGLANRRVLLEQLGTWARSGAPSVVFCDLDRFKPINDGYGHHVGDELLTVVARRLERLDADLVARLGGDEFVLVIADGEPVRTRVAAASTLACVTGPVALGNVTVEISGSVGVVTAESVGVDPTRMLRDADLAMYVAKSHGGGDVSHFDPSLSHAAEARAQLEAALRATIAGTEGSFALAWQPIIDAHARVIGREALVRWWYDGRWHNPGEFIMAADEAGLIGSIGDIVLRRACDALATWTRAGDPTIAAVNVAGSQLTRQDFVPFVTMMLAEHGIDPAQLCIEVTEESLADRLHSAADNLGALAELGVRLSIDDFGAGATSIAHLRHLPFHYVKLDRSFVAAVAHDPLERRLLADLVQLIHGIGRVVVVEGIETEAEEMVARNAGADLFQGFRFGHPMFVEPESLTRLPLWQD
ncbi:MAG TPA: EAL domain-containing protein [Acidimicrobiales bacterium]|nr:EAL domain-containing protein [Acidimicrobiales bacterium]